MPITERLEFDTSSAQDSIDALDQSLTTAVQSFKVNLVDALDIVNGVDVVINEPDTTPITDAVESAIAEADGTPVTIDGQVDEASITGPIDDAIASADSTVIIDADTSDAEAAIGDLQTEIDSLGSSSGSSAGSTDALASSVAGLSATAGVAGGSAGGLSSAIGGLGPEASAAAAGVTVLAGAAADFFDKGLQAEAAAVRFKQTFGDLADRVQQINVGGLNTNISDLTLELGSSAREVKNAASSLFVLGTSSGVARTEVADTIDQIIALAANARSLNPSLGSVGDNVTGLSKGLARGGRFLAQYGIALTSAEINARALADTGKTTATQLTIYDKAAAGAALATEKLGSSIQDNVGKASENPQIQLDKLSTTFARFQTELGRPLVTPVIALLESLLPLGEGVAQVLGTVLQIIVPLVGELTKSFSGPLKDLGNSFSDLVVSAQPIISLLIGGVALGFKETAVIIEIIAKGIDLLAAGLAPIGKLFGAAADEASSLADDLSPLVDLVKTLVDNIKNLPSKIPLFDTLNNLIGKLETAVTVAEDALGILSPVASLAGGAIGSAADAIDKFSNGAGFASVATTGFADGLVDAANKAKHAGDATGTLASALKAAGEISDGVKRSFQEVTGGVVDQDTALTSLAITIGRAGASTDDLASLAAGLGVTGTELDAFVKGVTADIKNLTDSAVKSLPTISDAIDAVATDAKNAGKAFDPGDISGALLLQVDQINHFQDNLDFLVNNNLPRLAKLAAEKGPEFTAGLVKSINAKDGFAETLEAQLKTADDVMFNFIDHFNNDIAPKIEVATGAAGLNAAIAFGDNLGNIQTFDSTKLAQTAQDAGVTAGISLALGMIDPEVKSTVSTAGQIIGDEFLNSFKRDLGISSPSKEAKKIGVFFNEGLIEGLKSNGADVVAEAERITKLAVDTSTQAMMRAPITVPVAIAPTVTVATASASTGVSQPGAPGSGVIAPRQGPLVENLNTYTVDPIENALETIKKLNTLSRASGR